MYEGQAPHLIFLALLLTSVALLADQAALVGQWAGLPSSVWLAVAIAVPILHQVYVWLIWRLELVYGWLTRQFGRRQGFTLYAVGFSVLFVSRPLSILALSIANRNSLSIDRWLATIASILLLLPSVYLFYSVHKYFGLRRAYGIDHFEPAYRESPFVREGIFRFTDNAMYVFGFLILWTPGLLLESKAALLAAFFNHAYIWVHYYCTELPDIRRIYGKNPG
jgi:hypothetical protein